MIAENIVLNLDTLGEFSHLIRNKFLILPHQVVTFQRGEVIYHQGDKIDKIGLILRRSFEVC